MTKFEFEAVNLQGKTVQLSQYSGKVLLIVNTASQCGYTPQYRGLEKLYQEFREQGFEILAFPCNQFGAQEPGDPIQISTFCETNYGVTFPIFAKIDVNGAHTHPLYQYLKKQAPGILGTEMIKWNFTKFLLGKDQSIHKRYAPQTAPEQLRDEIEILLKT